MSPSSTTTSLRSALAYAGNLLSQVPFVQDLPNPLSTVVDPAALPATYSYDGPVTNYEPLSGAPSCPIDGPISCLSKPPAGGDDDNNSCCFVYPGGRMLLTQFWDRHAHSGFIEEAWTLHGLWPDLCDGTYDAFCNMTPRVNNISAVLARHNQSDLLTFMDRYWVADYGTNEHLWAHEWNKHATCINTLAPACYARDAAAPGPAVVDYFARATGLFKTLDTYTALQRAGIAPHARRHYALADVRRALEQFGGGRVVLRCGGRRRDELHEAWYVYFVQGSVQTGHFVPAQDYGKHGDANNCAPWVKYLPKIHRR